MTPNHFIIYGLGRHSTRMCVGMFGSSTCFWSACSALSYTEPIATDLVTVPNQTLCPRMEIWIILIYGSNSRRYIKFFDLQFPWAYNYAQNYANINYFTNA